MTDLQSLQVLVNLRLGISHFLEKKEMNLYSWHNDMGLAPFLIFLGHTGERLVAFPSPA